MINASAGFVKSFAKYCLYLFLLAQKKAHLTGHPPAPGADIVVIKMVKRMRE